MRSAVILLFLFFGLSSHAQSVFDLRKEGFEKSIELNGNWEFYYGELLTGNEKERPLPDYIEVPYDWALLEHQGFQKAGVATYETTLLLPDKHDHLGLYIPHAFSAYRLFFNGALVHNQGDVQPSQKSYKPFRLPQAFDFKSVVSDTLQITIQVANYDHNNSGLYYPVETGNYEDLVSSIRGRQYINMFLAGGLFLTGFILLAFAFTYNQLERAIPFYALFSLSLMYRMLGADPYPIHVIFPDMPFWVSIHLEYLTIHAAALFGGIFIFRLFPNQTNRWVSGIFYFITSLSGFIVVITPPIFFTSVLKYYLLFVIAYVVIFTSIIVKAQRDKEPTSGYLIAALSIVFVWTLFQVTTFLNLGSVPYIFNVVLISGIVIVCNLALFKTFMLRINRVKIAEAEVDFEKRKNTMLSLISHEIKMPVATLQMNMEMMKASKDNQEKFDKIKDKMIDLSYTSVDTIKRMLHDFIYFMSANNDSKENLDAHKLREFLDETWDLKTQLEIDVVNAPEFQTDKMTLKYVINTLVSNARKYSSAEDQQPEFVLNQSPSHLLLELRDYGIGISADQIEKMGEPQPKLNKDHEVSGMGYYLAKELVERLGHHIFITSRGKEGTSVFIEFATI